MAEVASATITSIDLMMRRSNSTSQLHMRKPRGFYRENLVIIKKIGPLEDKLDNRWVRLKRAKEAKAPNIAPSDTG
jgi:hypothetical protein